MRRSLPADDFQTSFVVFAAIGIRRDQRAVVELKGRTETASFGRKNNPVLCRNDGGFVFADATATAELVSLPPTYQAACADFDNDGDLDLVTAGKLF